MILVLESAQDGFVRVPRSRFVEGCAPGQEAFVRDVVASIRNHVIPVLGDLAIGQIQPVHISQWVADLDAKGLAPATTRKAYQLFDSNVPHRGIGSAPRRISRSVRAHLHGAEWRTNPADELPTSDLDAGDRWVGRRAVYVP